MKPLLVAAIALLAISTPVYAGDPITNRQAMDLLPGLAALDSHPVIIKQNGTDTAVNIPWDFSNATLRLAIANNIAILRPVARSMEEARNSIVAEILSKEPAGQTEIKKDSPAYFELVKQLDQILDKPAAGTENLTRIKFVELKLDKNEIPGTVLASIKIIFE